MDYIAIDTETHGGVPWSIQVSIKPGTGMLVLISDKAAIVELVKQINRLVDAGWTLVFHHSVADLSLVESVGIKVFRIRDTLQEAFHQGDLPQKLKALAYRLLGVTMRTWEDVVRPASVDKALEWMGEALAIAEADLSVSEPRLLKTRACLDCGAKITIKLRLTPCKRCGCTRSVPIMRETVKGGPTQSALTRIIRCSVNPEYDIWEKTGEHWTKGEGIFDSDRAHIENRLGVMPILGIGNCKLIDAINYGASDADHTLQVASALKERRNGKRYQIDEDDRDQQD